MGHAECQARIEEPAGMDAIDVNPVALAMEFVPIEP
jgi:hypothetical protein